MARYLRKVRLIDIPTLAKDWLHAIAENVLFSCTLINFERDLDFILLFLIRFIYGLQCVRLNEWVVSVYFAVQKMASRVELDTIVVSGTSFYTLITLEVD